MGKKMGGAYKNEPLVRSISNFCLIGTYCPTVYLRSHRQINKPVGFYGLIAPPDPNAPSLECPPNTCHVMSKASRGPSAADLDHYGLCQTRS